VIAQTATDVLAGVVGVQATVILALLVLLGRTRERLVKLEEWARLQEKRENHRRESGSPR
jgi:hypothetical protein